MTKITYYGYIVVDFYDAYKVYQYVVHDGKRYPGSMTLGDFKMLRMTVGFDRFTQVASLAQYEWSD